MISALHLRILFVDCGCLPTLANRRFLSRNTLNHEGRDRTDLDLVLKKLADVNLILLIHGQETRMVEPTGTQTLPPKLTQKSTPIIEAEYVKTVLVEHQENPIRIVCEGNGKTHLSHGTALVTDNLQQTPVDTVNMNAAQARHRNEKFTLVDAQCTDSQFSAKVGIQLRRQLKGSKRFAFKAENTNSLTRSVDRIDSVMLIQYDAGEVEGNFPNFIDMRNSPERQAVIVKSENASTLGMGTENVDVTLGVHTQTHGMGYVSCTGKLVSQNAIRIEDEDPVASRFRDEDLAGIRIHMNVGRPKKTLRAPTWKKVAKKFGGYTKRLGRIILADGRAHEEEKQNHQTISHGQAVPVFKDRQRLDFVLYTQGDTNRKLTALR